MQISHCYPNVAQIHKLPASVSQIAKTTRKYHQAQLCMCLCAEVGMGDGGGVDLKKLVFSSHYIDPEAQTQVKTSA